MIKKILYFLLIFKLTSSVLTIGTEKIICQTVLEGYKLCKQSGTLFSVEEDPRGRKWNRLHIADEEINSIARNTFKALNISELVIDISKKGEVKMDPESFNNLEKLESMIFNTGKLPIDTITRSLLNIENLKILKILTGDLGDINVSVQQDYRLPISHLELSYDNITSIAPTTFYPFPNLEILMINFNELTSLHPGTFKNLQELQTLSIASNKLNWIDNFIFSNLKQLETLDLSNNQINFIQNNSFKGSKILNLILNNNHLRYLDFNYFGGIRQTLMNINLDNNFINNIKENTFSELHIRKLYLRNNKLNVIEHGNFKGLVVEKLFLSNNRIIVVQLDAFKDVKIKELYLSLGNISYGNLLQGLSKSTKVFKE